MALTDAHAELSRRTIELRRALERVQRIRHVPLDESEIGLHRAGM